MAASSDMRQTTMAIDLGGEQVVLERIECSEGLGKQFTLSVDIISTLGEIDLLPHLGKPVALKVFEDGRFLRSFHGLVTEGEFVEESQTGFHYRLIARPFTYFLSQNRDMAIFQDQSAVDIIKKVFAAAGASDVDYAKLTGSYRPRTYCVQYRESDFAFLTRLMEEEGIYYFFRHEADRHVLVLCDAPSAHAAGDPPQLTYNPDAASVGLVASADRTTSGAQAFYLSSWHERVSTSGQQKVTVRDFDLKKPERPLQGIASDDGKHANDTREVYLYPLGFTEESAGARQAQVLLQAMRHDRQVYTGESQASGLACGTKVKVAKHPVTRLDGDYLITSAYHSILSESYRSGHGAGGDQPFNVRFEAIPAATPFRMPRITPRPTVEGLESAIVSGPDGEDIFTDEYGRVKVRFHWDRGDTTGEKATCWIRVAQFGGLGNIILPRVGQEVMVDFMHGNPDHPIVCGWVFNNALKPVYSLPDNKTRSVWRTKRYKAAGQYPNAQALDTKEPGANELRFEDKGGKEEVFLHAERDMNVRVRFEETHHVGAARHTKVGWDRTDEVGRDETREVKRNQKLTVTGNQTEEIKAKRDITVTDTDTLKVTASQKIDVSQTIKITSGTGITLTCGASKVEILPGSVKITSPMVTTEASGVNKVAGSVVEVNGSGMIKEQGGVIMLN